MLCTAIQICFPLCFILLAPVCTPSMVIQIEVTDPSRLPALYSLGFRRIPREGVMLQTALATSIHVADRQRIPRRSP